MSTIDIEKWANLSGYFKRMELKGRRTNESFSSSVQIKTKSILFEQNLFSIQTEVEFKEFEPRLKYGWPHLK